MVRLLAAVLLAAVLAGCSTSVTTEEQIPSAVRADLKVVAVQVAVQDDVDAPKDLAPRLEAAVREAIAARKRSGASAVRLELRVTDFRIANRVARLAVGPFAGNDRLAVDVSVIDAAKGAEIGRFTVERHALGGRLAALMNRAQATIEAAAEGVADGLFGTGKG